MLAKFENNEDWKPWMKHWIVVEVHKGKETYRAFEPDNTCIYKGSDANEAIQALSNSNYGEV